MTEIAREAVGDYKAGWHDPEQSTIRFDAGLSEQIVRDISELKREPEWMTEWRLDALRRFQQMEEPRVVQGALEQSNVSPVLEVARMIDHTSQRSIYFSQVNIMAVL